MIDGHMHKIDIPDWIVERVTARRGRRHIFDEFDARNAALLVVDLQNGFLNPGNHSFVPAAQSIVPNVNRAAAAMRDAGGTVVWLKHVITDESVASWSVFHDKLSNGKVRQQRIESMRDGAFGQELWNGLDVQPADDIIQKTRFSALIDGSSNLDEMLRHRGIELVVVTGTVTSVCCESTARDAMMKNYMVIMLSDATADRTDWEHNKSLAGFYLAFGDVMTTDEFLTYLGRNKARTSANPSKAARQS
jgi:ureidoacrylate peracid hydrolase